jgi:tRNA N6-adenosine threonylcarbamoyltransferase
MCVLGIETSCDETSCAIVDKRKVLANVTVSSLRYHKQYGGVVPEIATRNHLKFIDKVFTVALAKAGIGIEKVRAIGATYRPGLRGALVVGTNFAKALSLSRGIPFLGIDHLQAHLFGSFLNYSGKLPFPFIGLVVSGGHTDILLVNDFDDIKILGRTRDDACGEVFDKVARYFKLGYPGGIYIDKLYAAADKDAFKFKCPQIGLGFSFSGIKTAVIYKKMELDKTKQFNSKIKRQILSSFQESVTQTITKNTIAAALKYEVKTVVCGGGVTANSRLRALLKESCRKEKLKLFLPQKAFTADNAAMVAGLAFYLYNKKNFRSPLSLEVQ